MIRHLNEHDAGKSGSPSIKNHEGPHKASVASPQEQRYITFCGNGLKLCNYVALANSTAAEDEIISLNINKNIHLFLHLSFGKKMSFSVLSKLSEL